ncbi:MAG: SusC/RagA family TonB-linked outer membrane protein [Bacteroidales bacterium]|nr:SusC/RagA family TonB-linked outer membrane protein [Bacteroidales bacterium]MCF8374833.1 SusC/RagA family TonB-linked outer membrane protein [Bacteroidales bacterium]MCF8399763.1 SusC/RagA family TonB-linked outer membrane protein [Bacteroidales bacterium]
MRKFTIFLAFMLLSSMQVVFAQTKITGKVTSAEDGSALIGASVIITGTTIGTTTDLNGNYELTVPDDAETLVFSYVGFQSKDVDIAGRSTINIELEPAAYAMDEVVVTALGISREKKSLGYAVQEVGGEELNDARENNIVNSLSGRVAGVQVTNSSGAVGSSSRIIIRGNTSLNSGNNQPLFVVDGTPILNSSTEVSQWGDVDFGNAAMDIDPANIESISVLKGANAAALYGSRGAAGVIEITTKKGGKPGAAQPGIGVNYNMSLTFDNVYMIPNYQNKYGQGFNGSEYIFKQNAEPGQTYQDWSVNNSFAYYNGNWSGVNDGIDESWGPRLDIGLQIPQFNGPFIGDSVVPTPWISHPDNVKNFFQTGTNLTNTVSLNAVGEKAVTRLSYTNVEQVGAIPNTDLTRHNFNINTTLNLTDRLTANAVISYIQNKSDNLPGQGYAENNVMQSIGSWFGRQVDMGVLEEKWDQLDRFGLPFNWNHSYHNNPYWTVNNNTTSRDRDRVFGNVSLNYKLTDWLDIMGRVGTDFYNEFRKHVVYDMSIEAGPGGNFWQNERFESETNADLMLNFNKNISKDFEISGNLGANYRKNSFKRMALEAFSLTVPNLFTIANVKGNASTDMYREEWETNSIYGRATFGYKHMLYLDLTARNDWSSTLPSDNWSYFYPSASLSWVFTEAFDMDENVLSFGKIRASYAEVGSGTTPYQLYATYVPLQNSFNGIAQYHLSRQIPPLDLKPELAKSIEFGTDLRFFQNRVGLNVTYYDVKTSNQIMPVDISDATGFDTQFINAGEVENSGVEIMLTAGILDNPDGFNWDITLNWAMNDNVVNELYTDPNTGQELESLLFSTSWGGLTIGASPGETFGVIKGNGFFRDADGNIIINPNSGLPMKTDKPIELGSVVPDWTGGVRNTFSYKDFSLSVLIDGRKGGDIFSVTDWFGAYAGITEETAEGDMRENGLIADGVLAAVDGEGIIQYDNDGNPISSGTVNDVAVAPQSYYSNYWGNQENSIIDGSFIKLREVVFTYKLPRKLTDKVNWIRAASISFVGRNIAMLYLDESNDVGIDPETSFGTTLSGLGLEQYQLPPVRSLGFKLNISF